MTHGIPIYPRARGAVVEPRETAVAPEWLDEAIIKFKRALSDLTLLIEDTSHRVDEYQTQSLNGTSVTQLQLSPDYDMYDEIIEAVTVTGPATGATLSNQGTVTAPAGGATIVSVVNVPPGAYQIGWTVGLQGAAAAADANNFKLGGVPAAQSFNSVNPGAAGEYPQQSESVVLTSTSTITITAVGAGTAGIVYSAELTVTPVGNGGTPFTLNIGKRTWTLALPPSGILNIAPVRYSLGRGDIRLLTTTVPGNWALELTGFADVRYKYK